MLVLLLMALIGAAAVFQIYRFNTTLTSVRADEASLAADVATLRVTLAELRAAEAGYVGTGQVPAAWMTRATTLFGDVESLAGKPREEIVRKMQEFKSGARPSTIMSQLAKGYTDEQIEALAGWFAAQKSTK